jgi:hypothetical protein
MVRGIPDRGGIQMNSRGFETLMKQNKAKIGERAGRTFAERLMSYEDFFGHRYNGTHTEDRCPWPWDELSFVNRFGS